MIKAITVSNFMAHQEFRNLDVAPINIIVGKNDTGKTGILKLLYATAKALEIYSIKKKELNTPYKVEIAEKLLHTFMPRRNGLADLVQKGSNGKLRVDIKFSEEGVKYKQQISFGFGERTEKVITDCVDLVDVLPEGSMNALFIPAKEVLTAFNDIRSIRQKFFGTGFDDTYLDLILALELPTTPGRVSSKLSSVNSELAKLFDGKIEQTGQTDQPFAFKRNGQIFSMHQTAEGIKKLGIISTLINNRQLGKGTMLFMDEPETALHPSAIRQMVEMLVSMANAGVQVFIATHSYFVLKQMAICAKREQIKTDCWSLERGSGQTVSCSIHNLIDGILPENSIVDESLAMYNDELKLQLGL